MPPYAELVESFRGNRQPPSARASGAAEPGRRDLRMDLAWRAYCGELDPPLKRQAGQPDDNVAFNVCRGIVDKGVSFLFGRGVKWQLDDSQTRSDDEKYLDAVWEHNRQQVLLHRLATNGGLYGQAFLKIRVESPYPRLIVLDSSKVTVETADDDHTLVLAYTICWTGVHDGKPAEFRQIVRRVPEVHEVLPATGETILVPQYWLITDQRRAKPGGNVSLRIGDGHGWDTYAIEVWNHPYAPIVACQNIPAPNDYWGVEDLTPDLVRIQEAINRVLSNINRIIRLHAHPKTWSKGLSPSQMDQIRIDPAGMIHLPSETAALQNLEMRSDLASSLELYKKLREAAHEHSRVPQVASGTVEDLQYLSAMAMQTLYGPLIEKSETKKATYGGLILEANRILLDLAGRTAIDPLILKLVWPEILPRDAMVESQTAEIDQRLGFSRDTLIARLGGDPVYEKERRQADLAEDVDRAKKLALANAAGQPTAAGGPPSSTANDDYNARRRTPANIP